MAFAITLRLDAAAAVSIVALWESLASRGISDDALSLDYPPHVTLAVLPDDTNPKRLLSAARDSAAGWRALPVTIASLGVFPGAPATIFLAPVVTPTLLAVHAELVTALTGEAIDPHYRPGHWMPHVTLAKDLNAPAAAAAALGPLSLPIEAVLDTVDVVRFRPVRVLARHRLVAE